MEVSSSPKVCSVLRFLVQLTPFDHGISGDAGTKECNLLKLWKITGAAV